MFSLLLVLVLANYNPITLLYTLPLRKMHAIVRYILFIAPKHCNPLTCATLSLYIIPTAGAE